MDAGFPNNAVAVCKKVMRNLPDRYSIHLKMGQIRAAQLEQSNRAGEALTQYIGAYRIMRRQGLGDLAQNVAARIRRMDPNLDLEQAALDESFNLRSGSGDSEDGVSGPDQEIIGPVDLPLMSFDDDTVPIADSTKAAEEAEAKTAEEAAARAAEEAATKAAGEAAARVASAVAEETAERVAEEAAAKAAEEATARAAQEAAARAAEEAVAARVAEEAAAAAKDATWAVKESPSESNVDPGPESPAASSSETYVDIGAMLLGDEVHTTQKSTRFVVPYEEPTGDDQADFERMLVQFKEKVSENIETSDVTAHYDLGTAYMEMGLLDEAIGEFQMVLRGTSDHLATYEMLGQTFLQKTGAGSGAPIPHARARRSL